MKKPKASVNFAVNNEWSEGEIIYLCSEWAKGTSVLKIAEEMERTPQTITKKVRKIGLTPRVPVGLCRPQQTDNGKGFAAAIESL